MTTFGFGVITVIVHGADPYCYMLLQGVARHNILLLSASKLHYNTFGERMRNADILYADHNLKHWTADNIIGCNW